MRKSVWKLKICFFYFKGVSRRKMRVRTVGTQIGRNLSNFTVSHCASHLHCFSVTANRFRRSRLINLRRFADRLGGCEWKRIAGRQAGGGGGGGGSGMQRAAVGCWLLAHFSLVFFFFSDASLPACLPACGCVSTWACGVTRTAPACRLPRPPAPRPQTHNARGECVRPQFAHFATCLFAATCPRMDAPAQELIASGKRSRARRNSG